MSDTIPSLFQETESSPLFANVAMPLPLPNPLTYAVPDALRDKVQPGMRAAAPLRDRIETGVIVSLAGETEVAQPKTLLDLPDEEPVLSRELLDLCLWVSEYYCCSWGEALQAALPAGLQVRAQRRYTLVMEMTASGRFNERQQRIIAELHRNGPQTMNQLARVLGPTALGATLSALEKRGVLTGETFMPRAGVSERHETFARLIEENALEGAALEALQRQAPKQAAAYLDLLNGEPERLAASLYERHQINRGILKALEAKALITLEEREFYRMPDIPSAPGGAARHILNSEQSESLDAIASALRERQYKTFLLQGITGSGKTEVYLQAIELALTLGRDAIILVPEISLTPQTVGRFKARFNTDIAVLHSGLGTGERYDEWRRAQRGEVRIVVGARSAIFAPLPDAGIIVVDEEHDNSYKQGEIPRYHARDVAIMRAMKANGVCVLGSATPSVESHQNCRKGKFSLLELKTRAAAAALPVVELIDMRQETKEHGGAVMLAPRLEEEVRQNVAAGNQVLLLLNRRGFAPFVLCPSCGWVCYCDDCQVTMTFHVKGGFLSCHYCNARRDVPQKCGECQFTPLMFLGTGTQKIEEYIVRAFPEARVERMDADTTSGKGGHAKILGRLAAREIDILIGTQMIAKGHDYPGVTLVGVINADTGLALPDFRAAEGVFQLLTQVAGRAGRGERPGKVLIQTFRPRHYAVVAAQTHDYATFFAREIAEREKAGYPPFRRMANMAVECEDQELAARAISILHRLILARRDILEFKGVELQGPAPATIRKLKKKFRWHIGLLSRSAVRLNTLCRAVREDFSAAPGMSGVQLKIDLDPYGVF